MLHQLLERCGIYYAKRAYMHRGIDWVWDVRRADPCPDAITAIDVGANVGQTTAALLKVFPRAHVHAFEPVSATYAVLERTFGDRANVHCNRLALSDVAGSGRMTVMANSQLNHLAAAGADAAAGCGVEEVEISTVEAYCERHGIDRIDILKSDTEGNETNVLKGAERMLRRGRVDWVLAEVCFDRQDATHSYFADVQGFLAECGLAVYCFYDCYSNPPRPMLFCNALFVRKGLGD